MFELASVFSYVMTNRYCKGSSVSITERTAKQYRAATHLLVFHLDTKVLVDVGRACRLHCRSETGNTRNACILGLMQSRYVKSKLLRLHASRTDERGSAVWRTKKHREPVDHLIFQQLVPVRLHLRSRQTSHTLQNFTLSRACVSRQLQRR